MSTEIKKETIINAKNKYIKSKYFLFNTEQVKELLYITNKIVKSGDEVNYITLNIDENRSISLGANVGRTVKRVNLKVRIKMTDANGNPRLYELYDRTTQTVQKLNADTLVATLLKLGIEQTEGFNKLKGIPAE